MRMIIFVLTVFVVAAPIVHAGTGFGDGNDDDSCAWSLLSTLGEALGFTKPRKKKRSESIPFSEMIVVTKDGVGQGTATPTKIEGPKKFIVPTSNKGSIWSTPSWSDEARSKMAERAVLKNREGQIIRDFLHAHWVRSTMSRYRNVALLWGNSFEKLRISTKMEFTQYEAVVKRLVAEKFLIFYDGDSKLAPYIRKITGIYGIGIFANDTAPAGTEGLSVQIGNPFLRMEAFQKADVIITNDNSISGLGMQFSDKDVGYLINPSNSWNLSVTEWRRSLGLSSLGLRYSIDPVIYSEKNMHLPSYSQWNGDDLLFSIPAILKRYDSGDLSTLDRHVKIMVTGESELSKLPGGAVVFGSSRNESAYTDLVYASSRRKGIRGIPVATGGSGGFMRVANAGAWDVGADSIGIPLTSGFRLTSEAAIASEYQSVTLDSDGYHTRIPLLLQGKKIIEIAPGGSGTARELATALVMMASQNKIDMPHLVFISNEYYGRLFAGIRDNFPILKDNIHLITSEGDWEPLLDTIEAELLANGTLNQLKTSTPPRPRNQTEKYPESLFGSKDGDKDSGWWD